MTVNEVSRLTGVSIRALQYYDRIGLLPPAGRTGAGYRLYDDDALARLQQILMYRELQFPLGEIRRILDSPDFDRNRALEQQIELLELRKAHLENLILLARGIKLLGVKYMDFKAFDTSKLDEYAERARAQWGSSPAYHEFEEKQKGRGPEEEQKLSEAFTAFFAGFGRMKDGDPAGPEAQRQIRDMQAFITEHLYTCTNDILAGLGRMYAGGGEFTENIDAVGGPGTAEFAAEAIRVYCERA